MKFIRLKLIPSLSQKILDAIRENNVLVSISAYPATEKILDKIKSVLEFNKIFYDISSPVKDFKVFMTLHGGNNPEKSRRSCAGNDKCRFLRDGKIYKCPLDALSYRFIEKFGIKKFSAPTSVDIYAPNFSSLLSFLDGNVEMCGWCNEQARSVPWTASNKPKLEDWLADPNEIKNLR